MAEFVYVVIVLSLCNINCCSGGKYDSPNEAVGSGERTGGKLLKTTEQDYLNTSSIGDRLQHLEARINTYMKDFRPVRTDTKVPKVHTDCQAALRDGWTQSGLYMISPDGGSPMEVFCDQTSSAGGWTVVQKRLDGQVDFHRSWEEYKQGFGELHGDFWLGNENLHRLTTRLKQKLRVELHHLGHGFAYAEYASFMIGSEKEKFKLHIGGYSGTNSPGDSLMYHNEQFFSTPDADNDADCGHCAARYGAGWWFRNCSQANLNGVYGATSDKAITWSSWMGSTTSLTSVKMMVKPADEEPPAAKDCQEVYTNGGTASGVYTVYLNGTHKVQVYCEQNLQGGGWTVFQRRIDGSVDFYRGWADYKQGFGDPSDEHWLGNDNLHVLTSNQDTQLLVELQHKAETQFVRYTEFWVSSGDKNYTLHVSGYTGGSTAGDSLTFPHSGQPFTTRDRDNDAWCDGNCAQQVSGAWWYKKCYESNLNGLYNMDGTKGIIWYSWKGWFTSLSGVRMMLKTKK